MKVVAVFPAFAPAVNELAMMWKELTDRGLVELRVVTGGGDALKNVSTALGVERLPNMEILRVPGTLAPGRIGDDAVAWAAEFGPALVIGQLQMNLPHARRIAARCGAKVLLHAEFWLDPAALKRRQYGGVEPLAPLASGLWRLAYRRGVKAVMYSNPREAPQPDADPPTYYLPWPHPVPPDPVLPRERREPGTLVYVGSLSGWKGAERLGRYMEAALAARPELKATVVGPATDDVGRHAIERLRPWEGAGRFTYVERLPRPEALALIGRASAVLAPSEMMGWGLIGDAWGRGTPVLAVAEHYDVRDGDNGLVGRTPEHFVGQLRRLQEEPGLWDRLSAAGLATAEKHSLAQCSETLLSILQRCVR